MAQVAAAGAQRGADDGLGAGDLRRRVDQPGDALLLGGVHLGRAAGAGDVEVRPGQAGGLQKPDGAGRGL